MLLPSAADFIDVCLNQCLSSPKLALFQANILRHFDAWLNPELRLAVCAMHMDVHALLFAGKEVEAIPAFAKNCWTHATKA